VIPEQIIVNDSHH